MRVSSLLILAGLAFSPALGFANDEAAGRLFITEAMLRPTYLTVEQQGGEFLLADSQFGVGWDLDSQLRTRFLIGSLKERQAPVYYQQNQAADDIHFLEAYAEFSGIYGKVKMGLMPLPLGYENRVPDRELVFPVSMMFSERILARRDFGLSFYTENNGYFTEIMAHNGEVAEQNKDGNIWASARWGWTNNRRWHVEYEMQVGRTQSASTSTNGDTLAGFDTSNTATWKFSMLSIQWFTRRWNVVAEGLYGDVEQTNFKNRILTYHVDLIHMFNARWGMAYRYDDYDANEKVDGDAKNASSLSFILGGENDTSRLFITATKKIEETNEQPNDELRVSWRLRPYF